MDRKYLPDSDSSAPDLIPGKRYRYTVTGTAYQEGGGIALRPDRQKHILPLPISPAAVECGVVELLPDPLPTTAGSVIAWAGRLYVRVIPTSSEVFVWTPLDNLGHYLEEEYRLQGATVLFDAGIK